MGNPEVKSSVRSYRGLARLDGKDWQAEPTGGDRLVWVMQQNVTPNSLDAGFFCTIGVMFEPNWVFDPS
jgi:hypothetical protein